MTTERSTDRITDTVEHEFVNFADATDAVLGVVSERLPGSAVVVAQLDDRDQLWRVINSFEAPDDVTPGNHWPLAQTLCAQMSAGRAPALCIDTEADPVYAPLEIRQSHKIQSYVGAPIVVGDDHCVGALCAFSDQQGRYTNGDLELLGTMAQLISGQLERELSVWAARTEPGSEVPTSDQLMRQYATTDAVTGTLNRGALIRLLSDELDALSTSPQPAEAQLVIMQVSRLEQLAERFGSVMSKIALKETARILRAEKRGDDVVARVGESDFAVLMHSEDACERVDDYCEKVAAEVYNLMRSRPVPLKLLTGRHSLAVGESAEQAVDHAWRSLRSRRELTGEHQSISGNSAPI